MLNITVVDCIISAYGQYLYLKIDEKQVGDLTVTKTSRNVLKRT